MSDEVNHSAEIEGGFILVARAIANSSLMSTPSNAFKVAIWLLARARFEDYKWYDHIQKKDIVIKRGEVTCNYDNIVEKTNLSLMQVRTAIEHLLGHGFLQDITPKEVKVAHGYMHFKIVKYDHYQLMDNYFNTRITQGQHRDNLQVTPTKVINKELKETNIEGLAPSSVSPIIEKPKKEYPDPTHQVKDYNVLDLIGWFGVKYKKIVGFTYPANFGKDGAIMKGLLKLYTPANIYDMINMFFSSATQETGKENWLSDKMTIGVFRTQVSKLLIILRERLNQERKD